MNQKAVAAVVLAAFMIAACSIVLSPASAGGGIGALVGNVTVGGEPYGIAYDPSNGCLYIANLGSGTISIISTGSTSVASSGTPILGFPETLALSIVLIAVLIAVVVVVRLRRQRSSRLEPKGQVG